MSARGLARVLVTMAAFVAVMIVASVAHAAPVANARGTRAAGGFTLGSGVYATMQTPYEFDGVGYIDGTVDNNDTLPLGQIHISADLLDGFGDVVEHVHGFASVYCLPPGQRAGFSIPLWDGLPFGVVSANVTATAVYTEFPYLPLDVSAITTDTDPVSGMWVYMGAAANNASQTVIKPVVTLYEMFQLEQNVIPYMEPYTSVVSGDDVDFAITGRLADIYDPSLGIDKWGLVSAQARPLPLTARVSGLDRYATSAAISQSAFPSASTVIIATGAGFADALTASSLAGSWDAPVLLVKPDSVPASITAEITRLGAIRAIIIGSPTAVGQGVEDYLRDVMGLSIQRYGGPDRYATAAAVAVALQAREGARTTAFVARGDNFPDALAVSPYAYAMKWPILLVRPTGIPTSMLAWGNQMDTLWIAGGPSAIPDPALAAWSTMPKQRMFGGDRYETAAAVAARAVEEDWATNEFVGVATGANFPDAVSGGAACGKWGGLLLLTNPAYLHPAAGGYLDQYGWLTYRAHVYGGTSVVSDPAMSEAVDLVSGVWQP